jgi:anti-sigma-K factor RskA
MPVTDSAAEDGGLDAWVYVVIAVAAVAVIAVLFVVAKKKK